MGGPKDTTPPENINCKPKNGSVLFSGREIKLYFNEFISLKNPQDEISINPFSEKSPDIKVKGKSIIIKFNDSLRSNTTYDINFGNSITDITEGNTLSHFHYRFSTGQSLDSMNLKGRVIDAFSHKPEKGAVVMLYTADDDSLPYKSLPLYLAKADADGYFEFGGLKQGKYKVFALKEQNPDYLYNQPNEKIAFADSMIYAICTDSVHNRSLHVHLALFNEIPQRQSVVKTETAHSKLSIIFRKNADDVDFRCITKNVPTERIYRQNSLSGDTVTLWLDNLTNEFDSLNFILSDKSGFSDTLYFELKPNTTKPVREGKARKAPDKFGYSANLSGGQLDYNENLKLTFLRPIKSCDLSSINILSEKDSLKASLQFIDSLKRILEIRFNKKEKAKCTVNIPKGVFKDFGGFTNDSISFSFTIAEKKSYGILKLSHTIKNVSGSLIIELLDEKDNVIQKKIEVNKNPLIFEYLKPGKYRLRAIEDRNNNHRWDTGNYLKKIQPEKVSYYSGEITIKANWDTEADWAIRWD